MLKTSEPRGCYTKWNEPAQTDKHHTIYIRHPECSDPQTLKAERGGGGTGSYCLLGSLSYPRWEPLWEDGWWKWLHNNWKALNAAERTAHLEMFKMVNFICILLQLKLFKINFKKF